MLSVVQEIFDKLETLNLKLKLIKDKTEIKEEAEMLDKIVQSLNAGLNYYSTVINIMGPEQSGNLSMSDLPASMQTVLEEYKLEIDRIDKIAQARVLEYFPAGS